MIQRQNSLLPASLLIWAITIISLINSVVLTSISSVITVSIEQSLIQTAARLVLTLTTFIFVELFDLLFVSKGYHQFCLHVRLVDFLSTVFNLGFQILSCLTNKAVFLFDYIWIKSWNFTNWGVANVIIIHIQGVIAWVDEKYRFVRPDWPTRLFVVIIVI